MERRPSLHFQRMRGVGENSIRSLVLLFRRGRTMSGFVSTFRRIRAWMRASSSPQQISPYRSFWTGSPSIAMAISVSTPSPMVGSGISSICRRGRSGVNFTFRFIRTISGCLGSSTAFDWIALRTKSRMSSSMTFPMSAALQRSSFSSCCSASTFLRRRSCGMSICV